MQLTRYDSFIKLLNEFIFSLKWHVFFKEKKISEPTVSEKLLKMAVEILSELV